jgi:uncharacterized protein
MNNMKELIEAIVKALVDYPDEVIVSSEEQEHQVVYRVSVHQEDIGKVIGKQGKIAKAIRTVVYAASANSSQRVQLEIND